MVSNNKIMTGFHSNFLDDELVTLYTVRVSQTLALLSLSTHLVQHLRCKYNYLIHIKINDVQTLTIPSLGLFCE